MRGFEINDSRFLLDSMKMHVPSRQFVKSRKSCFHYISETVKINLKEKIYCSNTRTWH